MKYTTIKTITLWSLGLTLSVLKLSSVIDLNWWWIIGVFILSFTTITINGKKF